MDRKLFTEICSAPGVSGFEGDAQDIIADVLTRCCDQVHRDVLGNVIALKKAGSRSRGGQRALRLMMAAHVDEAGMMVKHVDARGMIHFIQMGAVRPVVAQSQRVILHGRKPIRGVIPPRDENENTKDARVSLEDLVIDTGLSRAELERLVTPGDVITFDSDVSLLNGRMWVGRNFDDRVGCYCLVEAIRTLRKTRTDVFAVTTVQEEVGLRGARAATFHIKPDVGIAIDGSMARGAYVRDHENLCEPGHGTGIYIVDKHTIGHPRLIRYLIALCEKHRIPYQRNIGGGTDAAAMQQSRNGVVATTVGPPVRYMHSTVQLCHEEDIDATVRLLVHFMETAHEFMGRP